MSKVGRLSVALAAISIAGIQHAGAEDDDLVGLMTALQTYTHKLQLSLEHGNGPLAEFYLHEIEEVVEDVGEIEEYNGHAVGELATAMLTPALSALEAAVEAGEVDNAAGGPLDALVAACNACHTATGYAFIVIARNSQNPYLQSFEP